MLNLVVVFFYFIRVHQTICYFISLPTHTIDMEMQMVEQGINEEHENMDWIRILRFFVRDIKLSMQRPWYVFRSRSFEMILNEAMDGVYLTTSIAGVENNGWMHTQILFREIMRIVPCVCKEMCVGLGNRHTVQSRDYGKSFLLEVVGGSQVIMTASSADLCFQTCLVITLCRNHPTILRNTECGVGTYISSQSRRLLLQQLQQKLRGWWKLPPLLNDILSVGLLVEVKYHDQLIIEATSRGGKRGQLYIPVTDHHHNMLFGPNMYCVSFIHSYCSQSLTYNVKYVQGPFTHESKHSHRLALFRPDTEFSEVPRQFIQVEQVEMMKDNKPYFIVIWCGVQVFMFFAFCMVTSTTPEYSAPIGGKLLGDGKSGGSVNDDFPRCFDLRYDYWRYWSYQFIHVGYSHVMFNVLLQLLAGIPLEMVHGWFRVFLLYQCGVICGALNSALGDVYTSVVGSSGGGYCLVGIHLANVLLNWFEMNRPFCNKYVVLSILGFIFVMEYVQTSYHRAEHTSYATHYGGFMAGLWFGILVLRNPVPRCYKRWFLVPLALLLLIVGVFGGFYWLFRHPTPQYAYHLDNHVFANKPCCWQVLECQGLTYDQFQCLSLKDDQDRTVSSLVHGNTRLTSCHQMLNHTIT